MVYIISSVLLTLLIIAIFLLALPQDDAVNRMRRMPGDVLLNELAFTRKVVWLAVVAGFLLTFNYAITYFTGSDLRHMPEWTWYQWMGAGIGFIAALVITLIQRSVYTSISTQRVAVIVTFLVLTFVIFSELGTPLEREQMKMLERSKESPTFQSVLNAVEQKTTQSPALLFADRIRELEGEKAKHESELAYCRQKYTHDLAWWAKQPKAVQERKISRCEQYEHREAEQIAKEIASLEKQQQIAIEAQKSSTLSLVEQARQLEQDERNHSALILWLAHALSADVKDAMMLASLIFVIAFEAGFHYLGRREALLKEALARSTHSPTSPTTSGPGPRGGRPAPEDEARTVPDRTGTVDNSNSNRARTVGGNDPDRVSDRARTVESPDRARTVAVVDLNTRAVAKELRRAIRAGEVKPSVRGMRAAVRSFLEDRGVKKTLVEIDEITKRVEQALLEDGIIELAGGTGKTKYRVKA